MPLRISKESTLVIISTFNNSHLLIMNNKHPIFIKALYAKLSHDSGFI